MALLGDDQHYPLYLWLVIMFCVNKCKYQCPSFCTHISLVISKWKGKGMRQFFYIYYMKKSWWALSLLQNERSERYTIVSSTLNSQKLEASNWQTDRWSEERKKIGAIKAWKSSCVWRIENGVMEGYTKHLSFTGEVRFSKQMEITILRRPFCKDLETLWARVCVSV